MTIGFEKISGFHRTVNVVPFMTSLKDGIKLIRGTIIVQLGKRTKVVPNASERSYDP